MPKSQKNKKPPKRVLALPDLEQAKSAFLNTLTSKSGPRTYDHPITSAFKGDAGAAVEEIQSIINNYVKQIEVLEK